MQGKARQGNGGAKLNKEKAWQGVQCRAVRAAQGEQGSSWHDMTSAGHGAALAWLGKAKVQQI